MSYTTVLKIGGSIITDKSSPVPRAIPDEISRIAGEIAKDHSRLVVVHGAGSFGHPLAMKYRLTERFDIQGVVETHRSVRILNEMVVDALNYAGVAAVPVHPMDSVLLEDDRIKQMYTAPIEYMLDRGLVPVLHGDVVMDTVRGAAVLSGDQIVPYISRHIGANGIGIGTNTSGVLDDRGNTIPLITPGTFDGIRPLIGASDHIDVTGGMLGKVVELVDLAGTTGIESCIFNAGSENISRFLRGERPGTLIQKDK